MVYSIFNQASKLKNEAIKRSFLFLFFYFKKVLFMGNKQREINSDFLKISKKKYLNFFNTIFFFKAKTNAPYVCCDMESHMIITNLSYISNLTKF